MPKRGDAWTPEELSAAVTAYMEMLDAESSDQPYSKTDYNNALRASGAPLEGRTKSSVEYRMQNISAALDASGLPYINGYKPAKNVGARVIAELQNMIMGLHPDLLQPTADPLELDRRVSTTRKLSKTNASPPLGQQVPKAEQTSTTSYARCPKVKAWVLDQAEGICEGCGASAPFITMDGQPFLEVHHVLRLADGGPDTINNAVALCPNCHRRCHLSSDRDQFTREIATNVARIALINPGQSS